MDVKCAGETNVTVFSTHSFLKTINTINKCVLQCGKYGNSGEKRVATSGEGFQQCFSFISVLCKFLVFHLPQSTLFYKSEIHETLQDSEKFLFF